LKKEIDHKKADDSESEERLRTEEIEMLHVKKNELIAAIEKLLDKKNITVKRSKIVNLADKLVKKVSKGGKISEYITIS
jgi:hypothetical protein